MQDAVPEVKVLDFGLARITDSDVQATTFVTEMGKVQGTLPYMSPEQVRGNPDEIDLRTDVYALGVMLYEMVTGKLPYDISKAQIPEAVRIICEEPPRSLTSTFTGTKRLDADIATIAGKCLEKESARRYQSAAALGEDVQRFLTGQPILARPPSAAYQFRKLVSRHKGPFAVAAGAFVLLLAFSVAMTVQAAENDPERLARANALGFAFVIEGRLDDARRYLEPAVTGIERVYGPKHPMTAMALHSMGELERRSRHFGLADDYLNRAIAAAQGAGDLTPSAIAPMLFSLAQLASDEGQLEEAERRYTEILGERERSLGRDSPGVAEALEGLADVLQRAGQNERAARAESRAREIRAKSGSVRGANNYTDLWPSGGGRDVSAPESKR